MRPSSRPAELAQAREQEREQVRQFMRSTGVSEEDIDAFFFAGYPTMTDFRPETERTLTSFPADYPTADDIKAEIDRQWAAGELSRISYIFWRLMSIITAGIEADVLREANKLAREMVGNAVAEAMEPVVEDYRQRTKEIRREADRRVEDAEEASGRGRSGGYSSRGRTGGQSQGCGA